MGVCVYVRKTQFESKNLKVNNCNENMRINLNVLDKKVCVKAMFMCVWWWAKGGEGVDVRGLTK